jgi:plasmid stability protein
MVERMGHIQIRNVPDDLHRKLKARAASEGLSLSDYLLRAVSRTAERPSMEEMVARIRSRPMAKLPVSGAEVVRAEREARDRR